MVGVVASEVEIEEATMEEEEEMDMEDEEGVSTILLTHATNASALPHLSFKFQQHDFTNFLCLHFSVLFELLRFSFFGSS